MSERNGIQFSRYWAMPTPDTFDCEPIKEFVQKYILKSKISIDPFARNKRWTTYTNDLNPQTAADYHMEAADFLAWVKGCSIKPDLVILDPPYSLEQLKRSYESIGRDYTQKDGWKPGRWSYERELIAELEPQIVLSFGWSTHGLGKKNGYNIQEIMLVCHGPGHNDTICMAERRITPHPELNL